MTRTIVFKTIILFIHTVVSTDNTIDCSEFHASLFWQLKAKMEPPKDFVVSRTGIEDYILNHINHAVVSKCRKIIPVRAKGSVSSTLIDDLIQIIFEGDVISKLLERSFVNQECVSRNVLTKLNIARGVMKVLAEREVVPRIKDEGWYCPSQIRKEMDKAHCAFLGGPAYVGLLEIRIISSKFNEMDEAIKKILKYDQYTGKIVFNTNDNNTISETVEYLKSTLISSLHLFEAVIRQRQHIEKTDIKRQNEMFDAINYTMPVFLAYQTITCYLKTEISCNALNLDVLVTGLLMVPQYLVMGAIENVITEFSNFMEKLQADSEQCCYDHKRFRDDPGTVVKLFTNFNLEQNQPLVEIHNENPVIRIANTSCPSVELVYKDARKSKSRYMINNEIDNNTDTIRQKFLLSGSFIVSLIAFIIKLYSSA